MNVILTYKITESESGRSIAAFLLDSGYSSRLVVHLRNTAESFFLNGKTVFSNTVLQPEDCLDVHVTEKKASEQIVPVPADLSVVFEDEHVLVIDKPAGMPVHPSQGHYENTLANAIAWYFRNEETPFVFRAVNRLDRDTSGLILLAKNPYSSCILSDAVKDHAIHREYAAIVSGKTADSGTIDLPIARKDGSTIERVCDPERCCCDPLSDYCIQQGRRPLVHPSPAGDRKNAPDPRPYESHRAPAAGGFSLLPGLPSDRPSAASFHLSELFPPCDRKEA